MVKFNFKVKNVDADNIISALQDRINSARMEIIQLTAKLNKKKTRGGKAEVQDDIDYFQGTIAYTEGLIDQMTHTFLGND